MTLPRYLPITMLGGALLTGCASVPDDPGRANVSTLLQERGHTVAAPDDAEAVQTLLTELLDKPLRLEDAVRLAWINNPRLKAEYARLGFAAAEVFDAGRLGNPSLSARMLVSDAVGSANEIGFGLAHSFTNLLLRPARSRFAEGEFERVQQLVGAQILQLTAEVEAAHYRLAGAWQIVSLREAVLKSAQAAGDLAQRLFDAGNINHLELALEQAATSQARLDLLQAERDVKKLRGDLNRLMGLRATEDRWKIAAGLPTLLADEEALPDLLRLADTSRLDLAAARKQVSLLADALGVTRRYRYLGAIDVGVETSREGDGSRSVGPTVSLELPIFNQGQGRVARAKAELEQAEADLQSLEIEISNAVRLAATELAAAKSRAGHYRDSLIPLRETIVARTQERVNYMLVGPFELLLAKQQEYEAYLGYLEAVRDYWLARVELAREVGAPLTRSTQNGSATIDAEALIQPPDGTEHLHTEDAPMTNRDQMPVSDIHHGDHP